MSDLPVLMCIDVYLFILYQHLFPQEVLLLARPLLSLRICIEGDVGGDEDNDGDDDNSYTLTEH